MSEPWSLNPQLARDTAPVGNLVLSHVVAISNLDYPWLILVPRCAGAVEIADLDSADATCLMEEIARVSRALRDATRCDKLNVAAIGNIVPQLHVHIVARRRDDPLWPKPMWGHAPMQVGETEGFSRFIADIRHRLKIGN